MLRIVSDLRLVFRQLLKSPGFAITVVLMLALGIGATTTVFSVVDGVLLRPLPFPHAEQVVTLGDQVSGTEWGKQDEGPVTGPEVVTYSRDTHAFAAIGGYQTSSYELSGIGDPAQVDGARMTPGVFSSLEIKPLMGRVFTPEEDVQKDSVVVLSYATWMSRFSGDPHILGRKILLDRKPYQVIGVMPANFEFPITLGHTDRCELWVPMSFSPQDVSSEAKGNWSYLMVGRLKDGVSLSQAQGDAERVAQQIMREFPRDLASFHIRPVVYDLRQIAVLQVRPLLRMLFMVVVVVLLIACANLAGLLLVRAIRRQRESAVRLALGATVARLLWQEMLEGLVLCGLGGALGIGLAAFALSLGKNFLPANMPRIDDITLDWKVVGFGLCLGIATGILCGLAPAFAALGTNVTVSLKKGGRGTSASASHIRLRSMLVVFEIAIALILLTTSGLFLKSFDEMSRVGFGFNPEYVTTASYSLPREEYGAQTRVDSFDGQLLQKLRQTPAVQFAGLTNVLPASGKGRRESIVVDGSADGESAAVSSLVIGDCFRALEIPLLRGRLLPGLTTQTAN